MKKDPHLKVGFSMKRITPPVGTMLAGYSTRKDPSVGVHDDLFSRVLFLEYDGEVVILVSLDLLGVTREFHRDVARLVKEKIDLSSENIVIASTHTHAGPDLYGVYSRYNPKLLEETERKVADSIVASSHNPHEINGIITATGNCVHIIVNRRNPKSGPIDPRIHVLSLTSEKERYSILNFTCHGVVLGHNNLYISADYPGSYVRKYEAYTHSKALFFNGACGNINPLTPGTNLDKVYDRSVGKFKDVDWMGEILARESVKIIKRAGEEEIKDFSFKTKIIKLSIQDIPPIQELEDELDKVQKDISKNDSPEARFKLFKARKALQLAKSLQGKKYIEASTSALRINDKAIVFLPSEVFVEIQMKIKEQSPYSFTMVIGYANGYFGYIPTTEAYDEGGYETIFPVTLLKRGEGERLADEVLKLIDKI